MSNLRRTQSWLGSLCLSVVFAGGAGAASLEQQTASHIDAIRTIRAGQSAATVDAYNKRLDSTWQFLTSHEPDVLPVLRKLLTAEMASPQPSDFVLLDIGFFLHQNDGADGKAVARDALFRLNPGDPVVTENRKELFEFADLAAQDHDPRVLGLIEHAFLTSDDKIFIPEHSLQLDGTLTCVFLYGAYGPDSESALRAKLATPALTNRVLEILGWLGSPESVKAVGSTLSASPSYETVSRVAGFMMRNGGPAGREFMLGLAPEKLDSQSQHYLAGIRDSIRDTSFAQIRSSFTAFPGDKQLSDAEVKARLDAMLANFGKDDRTSPLAILDSGLNEDFLIAELIKVRSLMLYRLSDEAFNDVEVTNAVINGLRYRGH